MADPTLPPSSENPPQRTSSTTSVSSFFVPSTPILTSTPPSPSLFPSDLCMPAAAANPSPLPSSVGDSSLSRQASGLAAASSVGAPSSATLSSPWVFGMLARPSQPPPPSLADETTSVDSLSWNLTLTEPVLGRWRSASLSSLHQREMSDMSALAGVETQSSVSERIEPPHSSLSEYSPYWLSSPHHHLSRSAACKLPSAVIPPSGEIENVLPHTNTNRWYMTYEDYTNASEFNPTTLTTGGEPYQLPLHRVLGNKMAGGTTGLSPGESEDSPVENILPLPRKLSHFCCCNMPSMMKRISTTLGGILWGFGFQETPRQTFKYYIHEILTALMICLSMVPETIAFSFIAKVNPTVGLRGTWIIAIFATALGGSAGVIHGVTGAMAALVGGYVTQQCTVTTAGTVCISTGLETLFAAMLLASLGLAIFAFFHLSVLVEIIPTSVIVGYCNGLAVIISVAQLHSFQDPITHKYVTGGIAIWMGVHLIIAMLVMLLWPLIPKMGHIIPAPFVAILVSLGLEYLIIRQFFPLSTHTVGDLATLSFRDALPLPVFIDKQYSFSNITINLSFFILTFYIFAVGVMEALIVAHVMRTLRETTVQGDQEVFGLSMGITMAALFGGLAGSSMLALSVLNFRARGKGKEAGVLAGIFVFLILLGGSSLLNIIPLAALSGVMLIVVSHTFKWFSIPIVFLSFLPERIRNLHPKLRRKVTRWDAAIIVLVSVLCFVVNIPVAVAVGILLASLVFAWEARKKFTIVTKYDAKNQLKMYEVDGPLFFASKEKLENCFTPQEDPPNIVIFLKGHSALFDYSALESLISIKRKYKRLGKRVEIKGLGHGCIKMVTKASHLIEYVDYEMVELELPSVPRLYSQPSNSPSFYSMIDFEMAPPSRPPEPV